jgi:3-deoxy-D-manno-octulosonate cytidylyltransferase
MLKKVNQHPLIVQTYLSAKDTGVFDEVWVVTDNHEIGAAIEKVGGQVFYNHLSHPSGSDRISEAAKNMDADLIINVQGDTPLVNKENMKNLIDCFKADEKKQISLASLMTKIDGTEGNPNVVKVIVDQNNFAIYFSRSVIPYKRDTSSDLPFYKHIGVYAFRKEALLDFAKSEQTPLEKAELIECLRYLEYGKKIKMVYTDNLSIEVDTQEDLEKAIQYFKDHPYVG